MQHMLESIVNTETIEENRARSGIAEIKNTVQTMAEVMIITTDPTIIIITTTAETTKEGITETTTILTEEATKITNNTHR
jgi:hypothetical protein